MARQSDVARLLAIGLLNFADDEGYFYATPQAVRAALRPFDDDSTNVSRGIDELSRVGYLEVSEHPTHGTLGRISNFLAHQKIDKAKPSRIKDLWNSTTNRRSVVDQSSLEQGTGNREQGVDQGKEIPPKAPAAPPASPSGDGNEKIVPPKKSNLPTTDVAKRIATLFHRRLTTPWDDREVSVFKKLHVIDADIALVERYYAAERAKGDEGIHRRDLKTFLNNFAGEIDRARNWEAGTGGPKKGFKQVS